MEPVEWAASVALYGHRAAFIPWIGAVFWPYAYSDIFDYTFWPDGYDDGWVAYAYDDFVDTVFWGGGGGGGYFLDYAYGPMRSFLATRLDRPAHGNPSRGGPARAHRADDPAALWRTRQGHHRMAVRRHRTQRAPTPEQRASPTR